MNPAMDELPRSLRPFQARQPIIALIGVNLQELSAEALEEAFGMLAAAPRRIVDRDRRGGERGQRRLDVFLHLRGDRNALAHEDRDNPVGRPGAFRRIVDASKRLERNGSFRALAKTAAEIMPITAHGECRGADRTAEIESEDLTALVAAELKRHEREQHRLAGAGRTDDEGVSHVAA